MKICGTRDSKGQGEPEEVLTNQTQVSLNGPEDLENLWPTSGSPNPSGLTTNTSTWEQLLHHPRPLFVLHVSCALANISPQIPDPSPTELQEKVGSLMDPCTTHLGGSNEQSITSGQLITVALGLMWCVAFIRLFV